MGLIKEFIDFVKKQNVIAVALGLVIGFAAKDLVNALIADIITPIYGPYLNFLNPELAVTIGLSNFKIGHFIESLISFIVILFVAFIIVKKVAKSM